MSLTMARASHGADYVQARLLASIRESMSIAASCRLWYACCGSCILHHCTYSCMCLCNDSLTGQTIL